MRWGEDFGSLAGVLVAAFCALAFLAYAGAVTWASVRQARAARAFGDPAVVAPLVSFDASGRRAVKAVLLVLAMLMAFVALARPQFGSGTRLIPATNLDVVVVLDYSKSMYARDIAPSRIARAKAEVARLIQDLPGARFGAVAFAGEPMSFPSPATAPRSPSSSGSSTRTTCPSAARRPRARSRRRARCSRATRSRRTTCASWCS